MEMFASFKSLFVLTQYFTDNQICKLYLKKQRRRDDVVCPHCEKQHCTDRFNTRALNESQVFEVLFGRMCRVVRQREVRRCA